MCLSVRASSSIISVLRGGQPAGALDFGTRSSFLETAFFRMRKKSSSSSAS
ncbi:MAG: hypothetical protein ISN26_08195 [Betaproteobacteria bacterium AqS2]|uniref:Uncharacterized protein n=1 Tax=Candidatus Amphirhobacter heronislandensis TaxID=1732024 RepID=A0A930UI16_9GAMM|nr:hypothetical protein [Betaproteobacteria bacterium AqS2]